MSLYDDLELVKQKPEQVAGWSSGIKLFQSQLQLKKAAQTQPKREQHKKSSLVLAPVIDLKSKKKEDDSFMNQTVNSNYSNKEIKPLLHHSTLPPAAGSNKEFDWNIINEYDPMWPNDYEKVVKDLREMKDKEREKEEVEELERRKKAREERNGRKDRDFKSGLPGRKTSDDEEESDETEETTEATNFRVGGVAIAPPPSLQETKSDSPSGATKTSNPNISFAGSAVAAKIMAKYGFKEGQGLGKKEQGMALALQVEKTSKRGGRIIHERDILMPPPSSNTPPQRSDSPNATSSTPKQEPSITEIMKCPSKVVLLRNMVGPGEVDEDLEPEVKDECNTKYGEVVKVVIFEMPGAAADEAIRIFVEFKRIESAIKAVVDLNGRFFGGRQVKAGFYVWEKFNSLELLE